MAAINLAGKLSTFSDSDSRDVDRLRCFAYSIASLTSKYHGRTEWQRIRNQIHVASVFARS
jgi:hypothetical protein